MNILGVTWFTSSRGTLGVVRAECEDTREVKYYISAVDGFNEAVDTNCVLAFGARFPTAAGNALFGITE